MLLYVIGATFVVFGFIDSILGWVDKTHWVLSRLERSGVVGMKVAHFITSPKGRLGVVVAGLAMIGAAALRQPTAREIVEETAAVLDKGQAAVEAAIDPRLFVLFERDPESWPPRRYQSPSFGLVDPITPPLEIAVGERRRFNPQLAISPQADNVRRATVFMYFPVAIFAGQGAVELPKPLPGGPPWKFTEDRTMQNIIAYFSYGDVVKGYSGSPELKDVFYLTPSAPGPAVIRYRITGVAEKADRALNVEHSFTVLAKVPTP